ncbi:MAG: glycine cleavage system protein GcvH [Antricoccus sp.]
MVPEGLKYTTEHEWVKVTDGIARIGITHYAQEALGDIVFIQLPEIGADVRTGVSIGEVESTKSVSDLFAPIDGTIVGRNEDLDATPEVVNSDPYEAGWMIEIKYSDQAQIDGLLDADAYKAQIG